MAARWRQLTRQHLQTLSTEQFQGRMVATMASILVLTGHAMDPDRVVQHIVERFGSRVHAIVELAHSLRKKVGKDVTSRDLQILHGEPDTPYNPVYMTRVPATGEPYNTQELVLCTTNLGMAFSEEKAEANAQSKITVIVKAKVVLYSAF